VTVRICHEIELCSHKRPVAHEQKVKKSRAEVIRWVQGNITTGQLLGSMVNRNVHTHTNSFGLLACGTDVYSNCGGNRGIVFLRQLRENLSLKPCKAPSANSNSTSAVN